MTSWAIGMQINADGTVSPLTREYLRAAIDHWQPSPGFSYEAEHEKAFAEERERRADRRRAKRSKDGKPA